MKHPMIARLGPTQTWLIWVPEVTANLKLGYSSTCHSRHLKCVSHYPHRPAIWLSAAPQGLRVRCQRPDCQRFALRSCARRLEPAASFEQYKFLANSTRTWFSKTCLSSSRGMPRRLTFVLVIVLESTGSACQGPATCEVSPALTTTSPALSSSPPSPGRTSNLLQSHSVTPEDEYPCTLHNSRSKPCQSQERQSHGRCITTSVFNMASTPLELGSCIIKFSNNML